MVSASSKPIRCLTTLNAAIFVAMCFEREVLAIDAFDAIVEPHPTTDRENVSRRMLGVHISMLDNAIDQLFVDHLNIMSMLER